MTWPQRFPDRSSGSQFGWRTFQGKQTFHYGRDQAVGVGAIHRAHANGKVLLHGHDRVYGFYLVVEYDGAPGIRHHIHQLQDRGRAVGAGNFKKGDQLGLVGDPLLSIPIEQRFSHATYCGSTFSTGPHSHEEVRTATQIDAAIDPAGTQASNIWKTIETAQTTPAGADPEPLPPLDEGHDMLAIHDTQTNHRFTVGPEFIAYETSPAEADLVARLESATDEVHKLTTQQLKATLQSRGIPTAYSDPTKIPEQANGRRWWSRQLAIFDKVSAL